MDWKEDYRRKLVPAEEAVRAVKSGDRVVITIGVEPGDLARALAARKEELTGVEIYANSPRTNFGWFDSEAQSAFAVNLELTFGVAARTSMDERRSTYTPFLFSLHRKIDERQGEVRAPDVFMVPVSPPDQHGFCSFGATLWNRKSYALRAKKVLAEVDPSFIRTFGDNFIHVSQVTYFSERTSPPPPHPATPPWLDVNEETRAIGEHVASLIRDGDTIQIGTGKVTGTMVVMGALDKKHDLGCHSELGLPDIGRLVKSGIVTGRRKTLHPGKVVCTTVEFGSWAREEDVGFAHNNPLFELYGADYVNDIRTIAANDNMVAINSALCVDLTGQTSAESQFGSRLWNGPGGQQEFAIGALLSRGGRSLTVLPSTALNGSVSRIVPQFDEGTKVTIPRTFGDYIVTEYGVARLMGKSHRERAQELIAIAHPDFRPELEKQARKQLYP